MLLPRYLETIKKMSKNTNNISRGKDRDLQEPETVMHEVEKAEGLLRLPAVHLEAGGSPAPPGPAGMPGGELQGGTTLVGRLLCLASLQPVPGTRRPTSPPCGLKRKCCRPVPEVPVHSHPPPLPRRHAPGAPPSSLPQSSCLLPEGCGD